MRWELDELGFAMGEGVGTWGFRGKVGGVCVVEESS